jgi:hypothetical protein
VNLTVTIGAGSAAAEPGGTVYLIVNGRILGAGTVQVVNGVAEVSFTVTFSGHGIFTFDAIYAGSSQFRESVSNPVTVLV